MRLRADSRWGVRYDYDALPDNTASSADFEDLISFDGRLLARGFLPSVGGVVTTAATDIYEHVDGNLLTWVASNAGLGEVRLPGNVQLRDMGRPALQDTGISLRMDVAAGGGLVCLVWETSTSSSAVHVFDPATDSTVLMGGVAGPKPRVIAVGSVFWITCINAAGTAVLLSSFDPNADQILQFETDVSAAGAAIVAYDARVNVAGDGFWVALHRSTPSTQLIPVSSSGVAGTPITGPVTAFSHVSVCDTSARVHLVGVAALGVASLYSYTLAGALSTGPTVIFNSNAFVRQPGIIADSVLGVDHVFIVGEVYDTPGRNMIYHEVRVASSHVLVAVGQWRDSSLGTKGFRSPTIAGLHGFGGAQTDMDPDVSGDAYTNFLGTDAQLIEASKDKFSALQPSFDHTPNTGYDASTGRSYWPNVANDGDGHAQPVATEFAFTVPARRQTAEIGGMLYLAGGQIYLYDGRTVFDAGFADTPTVLSAVASNGAGALPSSTSLLIAVTWEWRDARGNFHTSRPSPVTTVVMGAADDTITVIASGPHSSRKNESSDADGAVTVVVWRSIAGIAQLRRAATAPLSGFGETTTFVLLLDDAAVRAQGVIYTQAGRGILGAIEPHEAPLPAEFICRFGRRLLSAGGPNRYQAQVSKELFPGEPVNWSNSVGFFVQGPDSAINGVAALGNRGLLFTAQKIYQFSGDGPNDNGESKYTDASELDGSIGLMDWRSLVNMPLGVMFQGSDGQLWLLPTDGSPPVSFRQVQETMILFPVVTSACLATDEQLVSFTCNNTALTDAVIVSFDIQAKAWIVDDFATPTPIQAAVSHQGRMVYLSGGVAYRERSAHPPATFIPHGITTGDFKLAGMSGWKQFVSSQLLGEIRGDCDLRLRISYDSGVTWTNAFTHELRTATLPAGSIVRRSWGPAIQKCERMRLDFQANTAGTATEGLAFNSHSVEFVPATGTARLGAGKRG